MLLKRCLFAIFTVAFFVFAVLPLCKFILFRGTREGERPGTFMPGEDGGACRTFSEAGSLAIVLDDCGYSLKRLDDIALLSVPLTLAVLPDTPYSGEVARFGLENNMEVILHMPMEPLGQGKPLEKNTLTVEMTREDVSGTISAALRSVPGATGVNNHMGSRLTSDKNSMEIVLREVTARGLFFLDSRTTPDSVCSAFGGKEGARVLVRDVFIDNLEEPAHIRRQMDKVKGLLRRGKTVIAIGHDRDNTIEVLRAYVPEMKDNGTKFVTLTDILEAQK